MVSKSENSKSLLPINQGDSFIFSGQNAIPVSFAPTIIGTFRLTYKHKLFLICVSFKVIMIQHKTNPKTITNQEIFYKQAV